MYKIALYCNSEEKKQIEGTLSQYLMENNVPFKIFHTFSLQKFMQDYLLSNKFHLLITCEERAALTGTVTYMKKVYDNFDMGSHEYISGTARYPLTHDEIHKEMIIKLPLPMVCPYGAYLLKTRKVIRKLMHEEIEFVFSEKGGVSIIFLNNGDIEIIHKSLVQLERELDKSYFVKCSRKYLINIFNIESVNDKWNTFTMKSGAEIPITRTYVKKFNKAFSLTVSGINIFDY